MGKIIKSRIVQSGAHIKGGRNRCFTFQRQEGLTRGRGVESRTRRRRVLTECPRRTGI